MNVASNPIQGYAAWFGGSVVASLPEFYDVINSLSKYIWPTYLICAISVSFGNDQCLFKLFDEL